MDQNQMMLDYLLEMGAMQPEQEELARKRATVDALRGMSTRSPDMRGNGRVQVAANPLEFLNQGLQGYAAKQMGGETDAAGRAMKQRRLDSLGKLRQSWGQPAAGAGAYGAPEDPTQANPYGAY